MAAPTQKGQEMLVGIGAYTLSGYIVETLDREPIAEVEAIKDENDATATKIIADPGFRISGRMLVKASGGSPADAALDTVDVGDAVTINSVAYMVESWKVGRSRKTAVVDFAAVKEASMTYS